MRIDKTCAECGSANLPLLIAHGTAKVFKCLKCGKQAIDI